MSCIARILDANCNRAREAMRMMEDAARFSLNDAVLASELKSIRHEFRVAIESFPLPAGVLEANRDTPHDVGREISAFGEMHRSSLSDVVIAAGKRLSEALRVIEECAKTLDPGAADRIQRLRYRAYQADADLHLRMGTERAAQWKLCVLLTESICLRPWRDVLHATIEGGADCIQVREKQMDGGQLTQRVREVIRIARPRGVSVIVNDRADVALASGADGVHLGQHDLTPAEVRRSAGRSLLIGVSTHDLAEADEAIHSGADYCGVGSMFETSLKPDRRPSGLAYLRAFITRHAGTPHLAIGGITPANVHELAEAGARGIAVSTAVCADPDPAAATRQLLLALTPRGSSAAKPAQPAQA